ncbi:MAG: hypothetical protein KME30_12290 [Iphinoe sp. HA4291-MV1]|jgi:hypothetical protein|nr:hypothetical protein [Iphinoe sp. HA4291-MV1]
MNQQVTKHDKPLLTGLFILNLGSGSTTILGALQILPSYLAFPIGGVVQFLLFLLLSGSAGKHAPFRKWIAVLVFSTLSIYTSFFTYYKELAGDVQEKLATDKAEKAHHQLVAEVFTPLEAELTSLKQQLETKNEQAKEEANSGLVTGVRGFGPKAREYREEAQNLRIKSSQLEPVVNKLRPLFIYEVKGVKPDKILENDRKALATVPPEFRKNYSELKRSDYIDVTNDVLLLAPFYKIQKGELPAKLSLIIAITVDGIIIMLGTAIERRRSNFSLLEAMSNSIAGSITTWNSAVVTVNEALNKPGIAFNNPRRDETLGLDDPVRIVTLRLKGKASAFLEEFYKAINPETFVIDYSRLQGNPNWAFESSYRALLDRLTNPRLAWVEIKNGQWCVSKNRYHPLITWLQQEILRLLEEEENEEENNQSSNSSNDPRSIKIFLPSGTNP